MDKAILIIDMPKGCYECKIRFDDEYSNWCPYDNPEPNGVYQYIEKKTKPKWCPLKELPISYFQNNHFVNEYWFDTYEEKEVDNRIEKIINWLEELKNNFKKELSKKKVLDDEGMEYFLNKLIIEIKKLK